MSVTHRFRHALLALHGLCLFAMLSVLPVFAGTVATVTSVAPTSFSTSATPSTTISVHFSGAMLTSSFKDTSTFIVTGSISGRHTGTFAFTSANTVTTFTPANPFLAGEQVVVNLTAGLKDGGNGPFTKYQYQFSVATASSGSATHAGTFDPRTDFATGSYPYNVTTGDLTHDANTDVVCANYLGNNLSVFKGDGAGGITSTSTPSTGDHCMNLIMRDLNGDGFDDVVALNFNGSSFSVLMNNGNGTFAAKVDYTTGNNPVGLAVADFNHDGRPDVAVTAFARGLWIHLNNGSGVFTTPATYQVAGFDFGCTAADFDGDGDCDIAGLDNTVKLIRIYLNNGSAVFSAGATYTVGTAPTYIVAGDFNGDGINDLALTNSVDATMQVFKGSGTGTFTPDSIYSAGGGADNLSIADIDGDGDIDIATANLIANSVSVFKNAGNGKFSKTNYPTGVHPTGVTFCDLNHDAIPDLLTANTSDSTISILLGNSGPLPIQISAFGGFSTAGTANLTWSTITETENYGFYIQRRGESEHAFSTIPAVFIPGAGTSLEEHNYSWSEALEQPGTYYYRLKQVDNTGGVTYSGEVKIVISGVTAVDAGQQPLRFGLAQNYPNPFNPSTEIHYSLPVDGIVSLKVYNTLGQHVATLVDGFQEAGLKTVRFELSGKIGNLPSGVYIYRLTSGSRVESRKMILSK